MKAGSAIKMNKLDNYKKADLGAYQQLIGKLMYFTCETKPNIAFIVGKLNKYNADPQKDHF